MSNVMSWIFSVGWVLRSQQANSVITISRRTEQGTASRHASFLIGRQREKYSSTGQPFVLFTEVFLDIYLRASFGGCYIIVLGAYSTIVSMQGQPLHNNFVGFSLPIAWDIWEHSREPNMFVPGAKFRSDMGAAGCAARARPNEKSILQFVTLVVVRHLVVMDVCLSRSKDF